MQNVWRVFLRDVWRVTRVPQAWIVLIGITIVPSLYAWINIAAFWDPYSNTKNINVAVVNLDEGTNSQITGPINAGNDVIAELKENHELGWQFLGEGEARAAVESGQSFAAIVISADFSKDLLTLASGNFVKPSLQYFVNEKANAISPKITDVGASTLEQKITGTFASTVAETATQTLKQVGYTAESRLENAQSGAAAELDEAVSKVAAARSDIGEIQTRLEESRTKLSAAGDTLVLVDSALDDAQNAIKQAQSIMLDVQDGVATFTDSVSAAYVDSAAILAGISTQANTSISALTQGVEEATLRVEIAIDDLQTVVSTNGEALEGLRELMNQADLDPALAAELNEVISTLEARNAEDQQTLQQLQDLNVSLSELASAVRGTSDALNSAVQDSSTAAGQVRKILLDSVPGLNQAMAQMATGSGMFSAAIDGQRTVLAQTRTLLTDLDGQLVANLLALKSLDKDLGQTEQALQVGRTDVLALSSAAIVQNLGEVAGLNAEQIAQFMASPVEVSTHVLFPIKTYGSAMAALFTNLTLWIGAFMLMVVFKLEVDKTGVPGLTTRQAYWARWMFLAVLAAIQGVVVGVGDIIIGVQHVNPIIFVFTTVFIAISYLSIIYALSVSFGYVGKGLCVLLVIMQIPGASGIYPIEMMPGFFRALYPFFPFTYGIDAMREVIAGFYGSNYARALGILTLFALLSFFLGLVLRLRLANLNRLFNMQVAATGLYVSEEVSLDKGGYRLAQVVRAFSSQAESQSKVDRKAESFMTNYQRLRQGALWIGLVGILIIGFSSVLIPGGKAALLALWVAWPMLVITFLIVIEYFRHSFEEAARLNAMSESELRRALAASNNEEKEPTPEDAEPLSQHGRHALAAPSPGEKSDGGDQQ